MYKNIIKYKIQYNIFIITPINIKESFLTLLNNSHMSSFIQPVVRVGVGAIVSSCKYPNKILVGVRKGLKILKYIIT